jgi:hypothetical protein
MNPFTAFTEATVPARPTQPRATKTRDKALVDRDRQFEDWLRWQQRQIDDALVGPHSAELAELIKVLADVTLDQAAQLVALLQAGSWRTADPDTRYLVIRLCGSRLVSLREAADLPPFDDPLPHEPPDTFLVLREMLR